MGETGSGPGNGPGLPETTRQEGYMEQVVMEVGRGMARVVYKTPGVEVSIVDLDEESPNGLPAEARTAYWVEKAKTEYEYGPNEY